MTSLDFTPVPNKRMQPTARGAPRLIRNVRRQPTQMPPLKDAVQCQHDQPRKKSFGAKK